MKHDGLLAKVGSRLDDRLLRPMTTVVSSAPYLASPSKIKDACPPGNETSASASRGGRAA